MADEVQVMFLPARTMTYVAIKPDGTTRTASTALTESGTNPGFYYASDANIIAGDKIMAFDSVIGFIGGSEYKPDVISSSVSTSVSSGLNQVNNVIAAPISGNQSRIIGL